MGRGAGAGTKAAALPQSARQKTYLERMAKEPHHAGSAVVAEYALGLFKEFGLDAHIENFEVIRDRVQHPTPVAQPNRQTSAILLLKRLWVSGGQ